MVKAAKAARKPPSLAQRGLALGVFLFAAVVFGYAMSRPWVTNLRNEKFTLGPGETLSIIAPSPAAEGAPLFTFLGAQGRNVLVQVDNGSLDDDAPPPLRIALAGAPAGPGPLSWDLRRGGASRANVAVTLKPTGAGTALLLEPGGTPNVPSLRLTGQNASLRLVMHGAMTGDDELSLGEPDAETGTPAENPPADLVVFDPRSPGDELLRVETPGGGALRVPVISPPGKTASIRYAAPGGEGASYQLGERGLPASSVRVRSETGPDRFTACGARSGIAWTQTDVSRLTCRSVLRVTGLTMSADGLTYRLVGPAFVAREGKGTFFPVQNFKENPVIGAALGAALGFLATWMFRTVFAPWPAPEEAPRQKARRASAKAPRRS